MPADDGIQTLVIETALPSAACLACEFSVERLMDAIESGAFALCRPHMIRAVVYRDEPQLRIVP